MNLVRYNRNGGTRAFDNLFDAFFNNSLTDVVGTDQGFTAPAVNIIETETAFRLELAAPGLHREAFDVQIEEDTLRISADVKVEEKEVAERYTRREFGYNAFKRNFNLPDTVDKTGVAAKYEDGILVLTLPKLDEAQPEPVRRIEIG